MGGEVLPLLCWGFSLAACGGQERGGWSGTRGTCRGAFYSGDTEGGRLCWLGSVHRRRECQLRKAAFAIALHRSEGVCVCACVRVVSALCVLYEVCLCVFVV